MAGTDEMLNAIFALLAFVTPILLPVAALGLALRFGFWWRIVAVLFASVVNLPLAFVLALLAFDPSAIFGTAASAASGKTKWPT